MDPSKKPKRNRKLPESLSKPGRNGSIQTSLLNYITPAPEESEPQQPRPLKKAATESQLTINGVELKFPFKPYPTQVALMGKMIRAMKNKENALLER